MKIKFFLSQWILDKEGNVPDWWFGSVVCRETCYLGRGKG